MSRAHERTKQCAARRAHLCEAMLRAQTVLVHMALYLTRQLLHWLGWHVVTATDFAHERYVNFAETVLPELYAGHGSPTRYRRYAPKAVYEDAVLRVVGRADIAAAFDHLHVAFAKCNATLCEVFVHPQHTRRGQVMVALVVDYVPRVSRDARIRMLHVVELQFAPDGSVVGQIDRWIGVPLVRWGALWEVDLLFEVVRRIGVYVARFVVDSFATRVGGRVDE